MGRSCAFRRGSVWSGGRCRDQTDDLTGEKSNSSRESVITFLGDRLAAVRWRQWRCYAMNTTLTDQNPSLGGYMGSLKKHPNPPPANITVF